MKYSQGRLTIYTKTCSLKYCLEKKKSWNNLRSWPWNCQHVISWTKIIFSTNIMVKTGLWMCRRFDCLYGVQQEHTCRRDSVTISTVMISFGKLYKTWFFPQKWFWQFFFIFFYCCWSFAHMLSSSWPASWVCNLCS